jgi:endonuclease/exonuclease/phosphatase family metal-dependent hydrolase
MKKIPLLVLAFGILFLLFIQSAGTLVESIYILDLLNSKLDEKVLGVLFFFVPLLLLPFFKKDPRLLGWLLFGVLFISRGLTPYLNTASRLPASGIATVAALSLFLLLLTAKPKGELRSQSGLWGSIGLALAVGLSTLLRTVYFGVEYSLTPSGGWVGWVLGLVLGGLLTRLEFETVPAAQPNSEKVTAPLVGIYLLITLVYFVFSAPAVIARWTEGNYPLIASAVSLFSLGWVWLALYRPRLLDQISPRLLLVWNILFTLSLTGTLLAHRVSFPPALESPEVVVGAPTWWQQIPLGLMLLLFPVIFVDMRIFLSQMERSSPSPRRLAPGILIGSFALILLIFAHIFTNVWGYVKPISLQFRNAFWLPHFLLAAGASLILWRVQKRKPDPVSESTGVFHWGWAAILGTLFLATAVASLPGPRVQVADEGKTSLVAMTYNTQQFNDEPGEKSIDRQIALVRRASPDILAMQETDSNRISLNNNDYVRYFAEKLGYYAYYGPTPITGTYGTAILSKYPLENTHSVFIYSDKDETGVAEAEVVVGGRRFTIYNVHPDSSDPAMLGFATTLLARGKDKENVIALGDYNLRDYEEAYQLIDNAYTNAWVSVYPSKISHDGVDMSGKNRIDHIFISSNLKARNPVYILVPESATDHAVHWTEITWQNP